MVEMKCKIVETPRGLGKVSKESNNISDVRYDLTVVQEIEVVTVTRMGPSGLITEKSESQCGKIISGRITVIGGERSLPRNSGELVLHLQDGRKMSFTIEKEYSFPSAYDVMADGGLG
jgi:hypothetical protein